MEPGLPPCAAHGHLPGRSHQRLGATLIHPLPAVIFSRVCVLVILDLLFDFSGWSKTSVYCEQMALCLVGSGLLWTFCWWWVKLMIFESNLGAEGETKTQLRTTDCFWLQFGVGLMGRKGPDVCFLFLSYISKDFSNVCTLCLLVFQSHVKKSNHSQSFS